ncbi:MAG: ribosome silencing factor [Alphaproteobacteria bacterium]|nr:ribosome silencing factor [Alphaproteobacteria bacterium]
MDLAGKSDVSDYMIVASGSSSTQIKSIAEKLKERLSARGLEGIRLEGLEKSDWVIADLGDVVVHLFKPEVREFYNLEKMWSAPLPEARGPKTPAMG